MTLGRLIHHFHPSKSLLGVSAPLFAAIFVLLDIISFIIQLIGGSTASPTSPPEQQRRGLNMYMAGIALQELFIVVFVCLCFVFQRQMMVLRSSTGYSGSVAGRRSSGFVGTEWGLLLIALLLSLSLITIRIIYRLVEFSGGLNHSSPLRTQEAFFYVLEATPMFFAILAFNTIHPGRVIVASPGSEMPGIFSLFREKISSRRGRKGAHRLSDDSGDESGLVLKTRGVG